MKSFFHSMLINIRAVIGLLIVLLGFGYLYALLMVNIPANNSHIIEISAGIILGVVVSVGSYYFGSSKDQGDQAKNDQQNLQNKIGSVIDKL